MKPLIDTHIHSNASDGIWTPSQVVDEASARGLEVIALTDHNTTYGLEEAARRGKELGIRVIPGIEFDAAYELNGEKIIENIDVLGLNIDKEKISTFVEASLQQRYDSFSNYIAAFNSYISSEGFNSDQEKRKCFRLHNAIQITLDDVIEWKKQKSNSPNPKPILFKPDLVRYITDRFVAPSDERTAVLADSKEQSKSFQQQYSFLFEGKAVKPTYYAAIAAIKNSGGIPVLAHPGISGGYKEGKLEKEWKLPEDKWFNESPSCLTPYLFAKDLKEHGLAGIELYFYEKNDSSNEHREEQGLINRYFSLLAEKLDLMTTYGSDCHGPKGKGPCMAEFGGSKLYL